MTEEGAARHTPWPGNTHSHPESGLTAARQAVPPACSHAAQQGGIVGLMLAEHRRIRRLMDAFSHPARHHATYGDAWLATIWARAADVIELHLDAAGEICYLPVFGTSRRPRTDGPGHRRPR